MSLESPAEQYIRECSESGRVFNGYEYQVFVGRIEIVKRQELVATIDAIAKKRAKDEGILNGSGVKSLEEVEVGLNGARRVGVNGSSFSVKILTSV